MPIDASIPLQAQQVNPMQSLSNMVNTARGMQAMQGMNMQNQQSQMDLQERQNIAQVMKQNNGFSDPQSGDIDLVNAIPKIMQVAPTKGADFVQQLAHAQSLKTGAQQLISQQSDENNSRVSKALYSLPEDAPPELINKTFDTIKGLYSDPNMQNTLNKMHDHILATDDPAQRKQFLQQGGYMFTPQATQQSMQTPEGTGVDTGQVGYQVSTKPRTSVPTGSVIPGTVYQKDVPVTQSVQTASGAPGVYGPRGQNIQTGLAPEDAGDIPKLSEERASARQAVLNAGITHNANKEILDNVDKATTGQFGGIISKAKSFGGIFLPDKAGGYSAEQAASAYDTIGKMTERNALQAASTMGTQTVAGLQAQLAANGSPTYNPTALKNVTKLSDAITSGAEDYQPGLEKAIKANPRGILNKREYDQAWGQNFDPDVYRLKNAKASGDTEEVDNILRKVGGKNSPGAQALAAKWKNLQSLSTTGQLPQ